MLNNRNPITPFAAAGGRLRLVMLVVLALVSFGLLASAHAWTASANTFAVEDCNNSGSSLWTPFNDPSLGLGTQTNNQDDCSANGGIASNLANQTTNGHYIGWQYYAPGGLTIADVGWSQANFDSTGGYGVGWEGDANGSGLVAVNDPVDPGLTNPGALDCYAAAGTQDSLDNGTCANPGVNLGAGSHAAGAGTTGVAIVAQSRDCGSISCRSTNHSGYAGFFVKDPYAVINDTQDAPNVSVSSGGTPSTAYHPGTYSMSVNAWQGGGGVCDVYLALDNQYGGAITQAGQLGAFPSSWDGGTGKYYLSSGQTPCGGSGSTGFNVNLATVPSGSYTLVGAAQNPGDLESGNPAGSSSTSFFVDNATPTVSYTNTAGSGWYNTLAGSANAPLITVSTADNDSATPGLSDSNTGSGIATIECAGGNLTSGGTVYGSASHALTTGDYAQGANTFTCEARSNSSVANSAGYGPSATTRIDVDNKTPTIAFSGAQTASQGTILTGLPGSMNANNQAVPGVVVNGVEALTGGTTYSSATPDPSAGVSGIAYSSCEINGGAPVAVLAGESVPSSQFQAGANMVVCSSTSNAGVTGPTSSETIDVQTSVPTVGFSGAAPYTDQNPVWNSGLDAVTVTASAALPAGAPDAQFGISETICRVGGVNGQQVEAAGFTVNVAIPQTGKTNVSCYAENAAGLPGPTASEDIAVSDSAPYTPGGGDGGGSAYSSSPQNWSAPFNSNGGPQIAKVVCVLTPPSGYNDPAQTIEFDAPAQGDSNPGDGTITPPGGTTGITNPRLLMSNPDAGGFDTLTASAEIQAPGGVLSCTPTDTAGNQGAPSTWNFNIDDVAPTGYFLAQDQSNPALVQARLTDAGAGVSTAQIQIKVDGTWQNLTTDYNSNTAIASATIPDDPTQLPDGTYALQVVAVDHAGNSTDKDNDNITTLQNGTPETRTLPLRTVTQINAIITAGNHTVSAIATAAPAGREPRAVTGPKKCAAGEALTTKTVAVGKPSATNHGQHSTVKMRRVRVCLAAQQGPLRLRYGQSSVVTGTLKTKHGVAIANAPIQVRQTPLTAGATKTLATIHTDASGDFSYVIPAGPSRTITLLYNGTPILRTSSDVAQERTNGSETLTVPKAIWPGKKITIKGQLRGGFVSQQGAIVQLWYKVKDGLGGWAPFAQAVHTNAKGAWKITFPFARKSAHVTFEFRAKVTTQAGWAFLGTTSKVVSRTVH